MEPDRVSTLIAPLNAATLTTRRRASASAAATASEASARKNGIPLSGEPRAEATAVGGLALLRSLDVKSAPHMPEVIEVVMLNGEVVS